MADIIENLKAIGSLIRAADKIEVVQRLIDVQQQALEILNDRREAFEDRDLLRKENTALREALETKGKLVPGRNGYWIADPRVRSGWDGPFCVGCWDGSRKVVRLSFDPGLDNCWCAVCKSRGIMPTTPDGAPVSPRNWMIPASTP